MPTLPAANALAPEMESLAAALRARLEGEVRFDETTRLLYSTDASLYQIVPIGVVVPKHAADVVETVRLAAKHGVPLLPRGSGTSLGGQTVGAALVLDFTKYLNQVIELNVEERWVRVQPGVVLDELNAYLRPHGLLFPPDVSTSNRASIGGMMGNNSSGARSVIYGRTVDHVLEQRVVLADGSTALFSEVSPEEWRRRSEADTLEGRIYREVDRICRENAAEVDARFPRIMRRVGGYNLDEIVRHQRLNLARIAVGSEGTLVTVVEAKLNLVPLPKRTALLVSHFHDLIEALECTSLILEHAPSAVELTDRIILDLTKSNLDLARARTFLQGDPEAILTTEFYGETDEELAAKLQRLQVALEASGRGYAHVQALAPAQQKQVWSVRKAGLGLLMGMKGDGKPVGFVEDTAVPVEHLADYIRDFRDLLGGFGLHACYYAHASVGCLHVRPVMNLKDPDDQVKMREVSSRVMDLVLRYDGAMSAEHGDGLVRSEWQERQFGPQLYHAFRQVKAAFDPQGIMNPGKIVHAPPMNENLRYGGHYRTFPVITHFDYARDGGVDRAVELCSGVGACRKKLDGVMCPSYRATLEEKHSTRGRANMLRMALSGQGVGPPATPPKVGGGLGGAAPGADPLADPRLLDVLDLCLACKACKSECPSNVDMAKLKAEVLAHWQAVHGVPLRSRFFASAAAVGPLGVALAPVVNGLLQSPAVRLLLERVLGIDRRRSLPPYAERSFRDWFRDRARSRAGARGEVLLLADTFTDFHEPQVGRAAVRVLEAFGYRVRVPRLRCCGRPMIAKGLLREARESAEANVQLLARAAARGMPLIGLEPSCVVTFKDEYTELGIGEAAREVAANTWMLEDFLMAKHGGDERLPFRETPRDVRFHGHCHQKAVLGTGPAVELLRRVPGYRVTEIAAGCCGMAGAFGFEREHFDLSLKVGELGLFPQVREAPEDALIVAPGTSCRHQLHDVLGRKAVHPAQALAQALVEAAV